MEKKKHLCPNTEAPNAVIEWLIYTYATIVCSRKKYIINTATTTSITVALLKKLLCIRFNSLVANAIEREHAKKKKSEIFIDFLLFRLNDEFFPLV